MVNAEIIAYIKGQLEKGTNLEQVKNDLITKGGWTLVDVDEAFRVILLNKNQNPVPTAPASNPVPSLAPTPQPIFNPAPAPAPAPVQAPTPQINYEPSPMQNTTPSPVNQPAPYTIANKIVPDLKNLGSISGEASLSVSKGNMLKFIIIFAIIAVLFVGGYFIFLNK